jgi:hypothetical protein
VSRETEAWYRSRNLDEHVAGALPSPRHHSAATKCGGDPRHGI